MKISIPYSQFTLSPEDIRLVAGVLKGGQWLAGQQIAQFEGQFAKYIGCPYAAAAISGTAALRLALLVLGVKKGDEVILPTYVCKALMKAVNDTGASISLVDVRRDDFNISVEDVKRTINRKTKAIVVPHMFGMPADLGALLKLDVPLIEDCAQAVGASYNGRQVGTFGLMSIFSFYATKVLTTGKGGMVTSSSRQLIEKIKDQQVRDGHQMTDFQAALGLDQLAKLPLFIAKRRRIAGDYYDGIDRSRYDLPLQFKAREPIYFRYVVQTRLSQQRNVRKLAKKGIHCASPVYKPLHYYLKQNKEFPEADWLYKHAFSLPIYPALSLHAVRYIIAVLNGMG